MVEVYYPYIKGDRDRALTALYIRIGSGLEKRNFELNP
jgi:hypothetical protein